jgi:hypothetical protein
MRAMSRAPERACSVSVAELSSSSVTTTPGWASWNAASASNSGVTVHAVTMPTVSRPLSKPVTSATDWRSAAAAASMSLA